MDCINNIVEKQREYFYTEETKDINFRISQLKLLKKIIIKNEEKLLIALKNDLNKSAFEAYETEIGTVLMELNYTIKRLRSWIKPKKVKTSITNFLSKSYIYSEPYGVVLIIAPWNYPFQLAISPLIGAIAAGNCAIIKPSEYATNTSKIVKEIINNNFKENFITVIEGGRDTNIKLLQQNLDYIFFTGSVSVGKAVMEEAAKNLTPVTLELGGKSPCIVHSDADIKLAAKKIVWGKFLNAGQTCVAPDYLFVHKDIKYKLISCIIDTIKLFFGEEPRESLDYGRIINQEHLGRLGELLKEGSIIVGGDIDRNEKYISPTIMENITWNNHIMKEEIFGPILPILEYSSLNEVITSIRNHGKPLALYLFTKCKEVEREVLEKLSFGGGCVNDTIMHLTSPHLPFGGVGSSGMGSYHGKASFDTFSHKKSILKSSSYFDIKLKYPPYGNKIKLLRNIIK
ncbi:aldehyde dehydrogenase [Alkaliphilus sp. MSJ-5]|uniref:Aldehyde dehydrogenase n=1 Tax=Alkaliphilus flagellatus TaxID=2841507 RepID=A0ABS6FZG1_9FIRM|nr:aldehyde dehydrogenase [Alkaliphilus flagellatus]MBU5675640.1 aldehyde dehydrogenase [Alkaliphilus flagellatus]